MNTAKKVASYILISLVIIFSVVALLGIWEIIPLDEIMPKLIGSLLIIFGASLVVYFIFAYLLKEDKPQE